MAPKEPFKVHSLSKHIEDTKKGLSAEAQYNRRPVPRPSAASVKREPGVLDANIFGHNTDSEDDESSDSDSSSDDEDGADFLKRLSAKASTAPKRRSQNDEIADSDVERNASAKMAAGMKKEAQVAAESSEASDESSSEAESDESEPKVKTNGIRAKDSTSTSDTSSSGSEDESDSSEDSEASSDEEEEPKAPTTKPVVKAATNGTAKATTSNSSSQESEEEEESEDEEPAKPAQKKAQAAEESSSSESEPSDDEDEDVDESMHISERENSTQVAIPNFIAPDFVLRKSEEGANGQDVARICNEANLQGKQVWYFTVPSNVPISVVQNLEIPTDRAQLGDRIFSHDGQDYGASFDTMAPKSSIQILIPSADSSNYQPARQQVDQTMQIKRITNLGSAGSSSVGPAPNRAPRPQPKGLKARYQPFGVNTPIGRIGVDASSDVDEDVEMAEAPTQKSSKKDKKTKKNEGAVESEQPKSKKGSKKRDDDANEFAEVQTPQVDRKGKRKHTSSEEDAVAAADQLLGETNTTAQTKTKKQKTTGRTGSPDLGSKPPSAAKKQTPIAPPTIPQSSASFAGLGSAPGASTPAPKAKAPVASSAVKKPAKKAKAGTPAPASSQPAPATGAKQTPVPVPRQTAVPLPNMIVSSRPKESPVPIPPTGAITGISTPSKGKRAKKQKEDEAKATPSSQRSALAGDKKKTPIKKKVG